MDRLTFNFVGRFKRENLDDGYKITLGLRPPVLNHALVPKELNTLKEFDRKDWIDLKEGIENFVDDGRGEKLETMLLFIEQMDSKETNLRKRIGCDFVCGRGLMNIIAMSISQDTPVKFRAIKLKDVIFMCVVWENQDEAYFDHWQLLSYTSRNFESKVVVNPDAFDKQKITNSVGYKVVNRVAVGDWRGSNPMTVFSTADVDATEWDSNNPDSEGSDAEILSMVGVRDASFTKKKSLRLYIQASLGNSKTLVLGHKNARRCIMKLYRNESVIYQKISAEEAENKVYCYEIEKISTETLREHPDFNFNINNNVDILYDVLWKLKNEYLTENGSAVEFEKMDGKKLEFVRDFKICRISEKECDFVTEEFLNKFD